MTDTEKALLGDREAAKRLTDAGVLVPCPWCGKEPKITAYDRLIVYECECGERAFADKGKRSFSVGTRLCNLGVLSQRCSRTSPPRLEHPRADSERGGDGDAECLIIFAPGLEERTVRQPLCWLWSMGSH